ncbi:MAG: HAMP domain-containing protein, partial [Sedimentisphaerales bacterium]
MTKAAGKAGPEKKRIFLRMTLLSWAVLVIALGAFILASIPYQRRVFVEHLESQGESLASSVSQVINSAIVMSDYSGIVNHCLEVIESNTSIRYIIVTRKDGFALVNTYNGWRQEQLYGEVWLPQTANPITIPFYSNPLIDEEVFQYSRPLDHSGLTWGWIHIGLSLDKLKRDLRVLYGRTVGLSLVCAAVGFVLSFAFAKRMTQPIIALHNATIRVRNGDLTTRAKVKNTGDEIESLALSFNEMAETLQRSHRQLRLTNEQLRAEVVERKQAETELKAAQEKLIDTARTAGMAEVAADVLHNVGNVLNSINVSATVIREKVTNSELANLEKVANIINEHTDDLGTFLTEHTQGKHIPVYLTEVSKCLQNEQTDIIDRLRVLVENVQHIKDIVNMQQSYAKVSGVEVQTSLSK